MMPLRDGWGWYPPQTASHIHIRHILSVWSIGMLSQGHILYHYTGQGARWPPILKWKVPCGVEMMPLHHGWGWFPPQTASHIHIRYILCVCAISMLSQGIWVHPYIVIPAKLAPDFGIWVTCWVKMMPKHHGWGLHPPQTASHIHIRNKKCVWCIVLLSQGHMGALLHPYTS